MSVSFLSPSRCVLIMGEDALRVYYVGSFGCRLVDTVSWRDKNFRSHVSGLISRKCHGKPVVIVNDMVEQYYRKERVQRIGALDRSKVLARRLNVAFPSYPVRGFLRLKGDSGELGGGGKKSGNGDVYLFAAVAASEQFVKLVEAVSDSMASIIGYYLLPVESADMVSFLSRSVSGKGEKDTEWKVFIGQHHSGGLRQIVVRNGQLALTRMTPVVDNDVEPDVWAKEVATELTSTISYLSRFGFDPADGVDVIVAANESVKKYVERNINVECNLHIFTSTELTKRIGIGIGKQEDERYVDILHAAWIGKKKGYALPLKSTHLDRVSTPRRTAAFVGLVLLLFSGFFLFKSFIGLQQVAAAKLELKSAEKKLATYDREYNKEVEKKNALGFDAVLITKSIDVYNSLEKGSMKPLPVIQKIGEALGANLHLDGITISPLSTSGIGRAGGRNSGEQKKMYETVISLSFPSRMDPEIGVGTVNSLRDRLKKLLPEHSVTIIKQVADLSYTGTFVGKVSVDKKDDGNKEDFEAQIRIVGVMK